MVKPKYIIEVNHLTHRFGQRTIYEDLNFSVPSGKIFGLLGKNGVGKTTLIKILMGFLRPTHGRCTVFGEDSHNLPPATRARIGLLFEGHLTYEFMTIAQIERFYAPHYPKWNRNDYYGLVDRLGLPHNHLIRNMSCGQRSQVVLGLIMAQQPDLLILDDYSMGLDAGYRRLFLDYMREYLENGDRTVFLTSHVIQDMEKFVDEVIFLESGGRLLTTSLDTFMQTFRCYRLSRNHKSIAPAPDDVIKNIETHAGYWDVFSFHDIYRVEEKLCRQGFNASNLKMINMTLEDAFIGYTGRY
ncbi:MAG: ABC transporter ATP-binding protein [Desulfobacterales bacterium]|nr:ABC transporter ATP-binding protein [Desulfobacterales bacterium]